MEKNPRKGTSCTNRGIGVKSLGIRGPIKMHSRVEPIIKLKGLAMRVMQSKANLTHTGWGRTLSTISPRLRQAVKGKQK